MSTQFKIFIDDKLNQIEFVEYDYSQKSYRMILDEAFQKDLRQIIFTTSVFKQLIQKLYDNSYYLLEIKFIDSIDNYDFSDIREFINQINIAKGNKVLVNSLLKEIDWLVNDESIDIKSIVFLDMKNRDKFEIYSNGVILGKNDRVLKIIKDILTPIFVRI
ncbi:hypothetical protein [Bacillus dakarensis]|uniref:hypothetical protein n=1 Tax=Robertmurraya dakarensis TaxID=1926278 RepID=UPI000981D5E3|nr:hypothetical protein [Bacillus dakarensis]